MISTLKNHEAIQQARELIAKAQRITLLTHYNPDGDGVSACAALDELLSAQGKDVEAIYPTEPIEHLIRQPKNVCINKHKQTPDLIIATDTSVYNRLYYPDVFKGIPLINIDHHLNNEIQGTVNFVSAEASSTCELLYFLLLYWAPPQEQTHVPTITTYAAECLLYGILYDTQSFYNSATTPLTLRVASELIQYHNVNMFSLQQELCNKQPEMLRFWGSLLNSMSFNTSKNTAWVCITQETLKLHNLTMSATSGLSNFLAQQLAVDTTILFYELEDGSSKASLRSKTTNVNAIASLFGGGGHKYASGIKSNKPIQILVTEVVQALS